MGMGSSCSFRITARKGYLAAEIEHLKGWMVKKDTDLHAIHAGQPMIKNLKAFKFSNFHLKLACKRGSDVP